MKYALASLAVVAMLAGTPAMAEEGNVPQSTLAQLGLGEMEVISDSDGMQVRGRSSNAMAMGLSLVSGLLIDPNTKSFIFGADANAASSSAENAGLQVLSQAASAQASAVELSMTVTSTNGTFSGILMGGSGGSAVASAQ